MKDIIVNLATGEIRRGRWPRRPPLGENGELNKLAPDEDWQPIPRDGFLVNPDVSHLHGVPEHHWKLDNGAIVEMSQPEKDAMDGLERTRERAIARLDEDAARDMDGPFQHDGRTFLLDMRMRIALIGMHQAFSSGSAFRPSAWRATDGELHPISSIQEFTAFHADAFASALNFSSLYQQKLDAIKAARTKSELKSLGG